MKKYLCECVPYDGAPFVEGEVYVQARRGDYIYFFSEDNEWVSIPYWFDFFSEIEAE